MTEMKCSDKLIKCCGCISRISFSDHCLLARHRYYRYFIGSLKLTQINVQQSSTTCGIICTPSTRRVSKADLHQQLLLLNITHKDATEMCHATYGLLLREQNQQTTVPNCRRWSWRDRVGLTEMSAETMTSDRRHKWRHVTHGSQTKQTDCWKRCQSENW